MHYGAIKRRDIANGPGVRVSLFVSGCSHHCPGCFNADTWDFDYGTPFTEETAREIEALMSPDFICGLSLLGGEPMEVQNQAVLLPLLRRSERPERSRRGADSFFSFLPAGTLKPSLSR